MRRRVVVERQQHVAVPDQLGDRFGVLVAELPGELVDTGLGVATGFGLVDLADRGFRRAVEPFREGVEDVGGLVDFMPISA